MYREWVLIILCITGVTAGGIGSFIGTPAEISLIRMTSDGRSVAMTTIKDVTT